MDVDSPRVPAAGGRHPGVPPAAPRWATIQRRYAAFESVRAGSLVAAPLLGAAGLQPALMDFPQQLAPTLQMAPAVAAFSRAYQSESPFLKLNR